jgi:FkbM family methyltransferase
LKRFIKDFVKAVPGVVPLASWYFDQRFLASVPISCRGQIKALMKNSRSQLRQDLFVLATLGLRRNGFFVEFGAADGVYLSNSWLLEKEFGWKGILAEPARTSAESIRRSRSAILETDCVWRSTGDKLLFREVDNSEFSTLDELASVDCHKAERRSATTYEVTTVSLNDLLARHHAPRVIDYLSIDTEGSEAEILGAFDFRQHRFRIVTCEHNYTAERKTIFSIMTANGYKRVQTGLSRFDDWYVDAS